MSVEQDKEIATIRERNISLNLSDADVERICKKAGSVSLSVSELLENFIGDLVNGTYTNGSDERRLADEWFDRCWFGMFPYNTFLSYLISFDDVEDTIDDWNKIKFYKGFEKLDEDDKECLEEKEERINERFEEFQGQRKVDEDPVTFTVEMEKVIKWWDEYTQIQGEVIDPYKDYFDKHPPYPVYTDEKKFYTP